MHHSQDDSLEVVYSMHLRGWRPNPGRWKNHRASTWKTTVRTLNTNRCIGYATLSLKDSMWEDEGMENALDLRSARWPYFVQFHLTITRGTWKETGKRCYWWAVFRNLIFAALVLSHRRYMKHPVFTDFITNAYFIRWLLRRVCTCQNVRSVALVSVNSL